MHSAGVDLDTAEEMPVHYALAFLSEKMGIVEKAKRELGRERQNNSHAKNGANTGTSKTYVSTRRVCK